MRIFNLIAAVGVGIWGTGALANPDVWKNEWPKTDFENTSVENWVEILSGGPPKDGIPALSDPSLIAVSAENRIGDRQLARFRPCHRHQFAAQGHIYRLAAYLRSMRAWYFLGYSADGF